MSLKRFTLISRTVICLYLVFGIFFHGFYKWFSNNRIFVIRCPTSMVMTRLVHSKVAFSNDRLQFYNTTPRTLAFKKWHYMITCYKVIEEKENNVNISDINCRGVVPILIREGLEQLCFIHIHQKQRSVAIKIALTQL